MLSDPGFRSGEWEVVVAGDASGGTGMQLTWSRSRGDQPLSVRILAVYTLGPPCTWFVEQTARVCTRTLVRMVLISPWALESEDEQ